jgi:hypothetical protein
VSGGFAVLPPPQKAADRDIGAENEEVASNNEKYQLEVPVENSKRVQRDHADASDEEEEDTRQPFEPFHVLLHSAKSIRQG